MSDSKDLRSTLTALQSEQGFTPTLLLLESVFHHPDSGSTQNTHISFYVRLAWEREGLVYEPHHLKQFLSPSGWSQVLKAHENGEFELEATGKIPEIPEGFSFEDFRAALMNGDFELDLTHMIPEGADVEAFRKSLKEETITPAMIEWTTRVFGHPVTETAPSSLRMVMNAQGAYERL